ncbi:Alpha/Beta hydrolase protein [Tribonema minus]|uniref:Alpha/Beta hydrolase protein n=1 Tax=Tribonema minus TaxID=303371 RepID=A0A836CFD6_9STRA|nr:Alpha/Beta hydrolase protein [Tribonema minus]
MPLLVVNGGPGGTHDYMLPFRYMACRASPSGTRYRIIFYDQLGSGRSAVRNSTGEPQAATAPSVWYLTAELQAMVQGVVLRKNSGPFHLLGQGFGGLIALSYATTYPDFTQEKMASLILASPAAPNMHSVVDGVVANMKAQMPAPYFQVLMSGNTTDPAWGAALANYNNLMVLRLTPTPDCVLSTVAGSSDAMRTALWGHQPWQLTGNAARTDLKRDLPRVRHFFNHKLQPHS